MLTEDEQSRRALKAFNFDPRTCLQDVHSKCAIKTCTQDVHSRRQLKGFNGDSGRALMTYTPDIHSNVQSRRALETYTQDVH